MHKFKNLQLAHEMVEENYVIVKRKDIEVWKQRGFQKVRRYPIFRYIPKISEVIMLGRPRTIQEFTISNIVGGRIVDICTCEGTYGMGGQGFFGITFEKEEVKYILTYCIWAAGEHVLLNNRVLECHSDFSELYKPWIGEGERWQRDQNNLKELLRDAVINKVDLEDHSLRIQMVSKDGVEHYLFTEKQSDAFPPQGGTGKRRLSYKEGCMGDYWLVTYAPSVLVV